MTPEIRKRMLFIKRMAISHLTITQIKEKTKTFVPKNGATSLKSEYEAIDKLFCEIEAQLNPTN